MGSATFDEDEEADGDMRRPPQRCASQRRGRLLLSESVTSLRTHGSDRTVTFRAFAELDGGSAAEPYTPKRKFATAATRQRRHSSNGPSLPPSDDGACPREGRRAPSRCAAPPWRDEPRAWWRWRGRPHLSRGIGGAAGGAGIAARGRELGGPGRLAKDGGIDPVDVCLSGSTQSAMFR